MRFTLYFDQNINVTILELIVCIKPLSPSALEYATYSYNIHMTVYLKHAGLCSVSIPS